MHNIVFAATGVDSKIWIFLKANYLKYHELAKLLDQVISNQVK